MRDYSTTVSASPALMADLDLSAIKDREPEFPLEGKTASVEIYADMMIVRRNFASQRSSSQQQPPSPSPRAIIDSDGVILSDDGGAGRKQPITKFSRKSRANMFRLLAKLRNVDVGAFVTLTYPGQFHGDFVRVKRDLKVFKQRVERKFPAAGGIWRLELKPRKTGESRGEIAPHFHVLLFGVDVSSPDQLEALKTWLCEAWHGVVGYGGSDHLERGADVTEIRSRQQARHYVGKYAAKSDASETDAKAVLCGRRWGAFGKLDLAIAIAFDLTHDEAIALRRIVVRWMKSRSSRYASKLARYSEVVGFTAFGLGDMSHGNWTVFDCTAFRMVTKL